MDVKFTFLNDPLEEVYVNQPQGFEVTNEEYKAYKLKTSLYGLKQDLRVWNRRIESFFQKVSFEKYSCEHQLYVKALN